MRKWFLFTCLIASLLCLAGCSLGGGKNGAGDETAQAGELLIGDAFPQTDLVSKFQTLPSEKYFEYGNVHFALDATYCRIRVDLGNQIYGISRIDSAGNASNLILPARTEPPFESVQTFCTTDEGEIYAVVAAQTKSEETWLYQEYYLVRYDKTGKELSRSPLSAQDKEESEGFQGCPMERDADGNFLIAKSSLWIVTPDGNKTGEIRLQEGRQVHQLARTMEGDVYAVTDGERGFVLSKVNSQARTLEEVTEAPASLSGIGTTDRENGLLLYSAEGLYGFDLSERKLTPILRWSDRGVQGQAVQGITQRGDAFVAYYKDGEETEVMILKPSEGEKKEPQRLVIAGLYDDYYFSQIVAAYNRSQSDWQVVQKAYAQAGDDMRASVDKMMIDILGAAPPDLINVDYLYSTEVSLTVTDLVRKNYVEDLWPYLSKSTEISRSGLEERVLEVCNVDGKLAAIPRKFSLQALMVDAATFGEKDHWTIQEMIAYDKAHPETELMSNCTSKTVLGLITFYCLGDFIDLEKKEVRLKNSEFRDVMEYAATYPEDRGQGTWYAPFSRLGQPAKDPLIRHNYLTELMMGIQGSRCQYFGGRAEFIGFPNSQGTFKTSIQPLDATLAICSKGKNKEGAWKFMEFVLNYDKDVVSDLNYGTPGFPTNKRLMQYLIDKFSDPEGFLVWVLSNGEHRYKYEYNYTDEDGVTVSQPRIPLNEEEISMFYKLLNHASLDYSLYGDVRNVILEESEPYFAGQKGLDETLDVMENRIRLYLNEND